MNTIMDKLNTAIALHQNGKLNEASLLYKEVLKIDNQNPNALYLQGLILYNKKDLHNAYNHAIKASQLLSSYEIFKLLGDICLEKRALDEAITHYEKAIELNPKLSDAFYNLGIIYFTEKNYKKAIENYMKAINIKSDYKDAYFNLGHAFLMDQDLQNAIYSFEEVTNIDPDSHEAFYNLGIAYEKNDQTDRALLVYKEAVFLNPNYKEAYFKLGLSYYKKNDFVNAASYFEKAISIDPLFVSALNNLGLSYYYLLKIDKALECFLKANAIAPDDPEIYINLGNAYKEQHNFNDAIKCSEKALELKPNYKEVEFNLGLAYLYTGKYEKGWEYFDNRLTISGSFYYQSTLKPKWTGQDLTNKTIYVHHESGFGDVIQFARYLPILKSKAKKVIFRPQPQLETLFLSNNLGTEIIPNSTKDEDLEFDYYLNIMSIPYMIKSKSEKDIPFLQTPYIKPDPEKVKYFKENFFNNNDFKIGINWQCKNIFFRDKARSIDNISELFELTKIKGTKIYSFQKGEAEKQLETIPEDIEIVNLGKEFKYFTDTAAAIENLDLLITVDTGYLHLAGAIGKNTCALLPFVPSWRWHLINENQEYLWYKNMKVFRQTEPGKWNDPISGVIKHVKFLIN